MSASTKVKVKQGTIIGGQRTLPNGNTYNYFQGIPYAVPPLGVLRFQAPVPLEKFSTPEINCTKEGMISPQKDGFTGKVIGSEDCLFLNVYTPKSKNDAVLPVMVYIHGGGFVLGSGNSNFHNPIYLIQEQVVIVTFNYRLGVLGFLSLPEANIPGNAALKDQRLALKWVKENISQFNGDPNNITLFGESAGGVFAHLHTLSEGSKNLFHKAIFQSGLGNMTWAIENDASNKTKKMAREMGCTSNDPLEIAKFLQNYPDCDEFVKLGHGSLGIDDVFLGRPVPIKPVIEKQNPDAIVTRPPSESMNDANSIDIPLMMGFNSVEAIAVLPSVIPNIEDYNDLRKVIPTSINLTHKDPRSRDFANSVRDLYFKGEKLSRRTLSGFADLLSDISINVDSIEAAEIHSRKQHKSPLFFYRFDYDGSLNLFKNKIFHLKMMKGACHADELFYIFQSAMAPEPWDVEAKQMVQTMCKLWTNFAKYNNPTPALDANCADCIWVPVKKIGEKDEFILNAFIIDKHKKMINKPYNNRIAFWRDIKKTYNNE